MKSGYFPLLILYFRLDYFSQYEDRASVLIKSGYLRFLPLICYFSNTRMWRTELYDNRASVLIKSGYLRFLPLISYFSNTRIWRTELYDIVHIWWRRNEKIETWNSLVKSTQFSQSAYVFLFWEKDSYLLFNLWDNGSLYN